MAAAPNQELEEFKIMRQRAQQQNTANQQQATDALKRRFAAQGGTNAGAFMKAQERVGQQLRQEAQAAQENIGLAESAEKRRLAEIQAQRDFASQEAEKQRGFEAGQGELQRTFASGEQEKQRGFTAGEAQKQRDYQKNMFDQTFAFEKETKNRELNMAEQQMKQDYANTMFNVVVAMKQANIHPEWFRNYLAANIPLFDVIANGGDLRTIDHLFSTPIKTVPPGQSARNGSSPSTIAVPSWKLGGGA